MPVLTRPMKNELPSQVKETSCSSLSNIMTSSTNTKHNYLFIDTRTFAEFSKCHIKNSINTCLPSTLLKRSNYTLDRLINNLSKSQQLLFEDSSKNVIIYDQLTENLNYPSSTIVYISQKFINYKWKGNVFVLAGGFKKFFEMFPNLVESKRALFHNSQNSSSNPNSKSNININLNSTSTSTSTSNSNTNLNQLNKSSSSIIMSNNSNNSSTGNGFGFIFPTNNNNKNNNDILIRNLQQNSMFSHHNNESEINVDQSFQIKLDEKKLNLKPLNLNVSIPNWIKLNAMDNKNGPNRIAREFYKIEKAESNRLKQALRCTSNNNNASNHSSSNINMDIDNENGLTIRSGVERGTKNRYKNIFPYDYTRVKIKQSDDDYFNASYISSKQSKQKYIATQGPLPDTIEDFWKVIFEQKIKCIINLTAENEGGLIKCHKYWKNGVFGNIKLKIIDEKLKKLNDLTKTEVKIRKFEIINLSLSSASSNKHYCYQIHYSVWSDLGTPVSPLDLLSLSELKNKFIKGYESIPTVVHCSAGCGRTGTFCTIDTIIDIFKNDLIEKKYLINNDDNLIYNIVGQFRSQRISMVQTLRQYLFCYEVVLLWMRMNQNLLPKISNSSSSSSSGSSSSNSTINHSSTSSSLRHEHQYHSKTDLHSTNSSSSSSSSRFH